MRLSRLGPLILLSITALYLAAGSTLGMSHYDEGLMAVGAWRLANGELPYRDFWAIYPPGQYYVLALLFQIFGPALLVGRFYGAFIHLATVALGSYLSGLLGGRQAAWGTWLLLTIWLGPSGLHLYPVGPAIVLGLLSCFLVCWSVPTPTAARVLLAGAAVGITCLFRYDYGFYAFLAGILVLAAGGSTREPSAILRRWLLYACGIAVIVLPAAAALLSKMEPRLLYSSFVDFPLHIYPRFRGLPYPLPFPRAAEITELAGSFGGPLRLLAMLLLVLRKLLFYFPVVVLLAALAELWVIAKPRRSEPAAAPQPGSSRRWLLASLLVFCAGSLNTVRVRPDLEHMEAPISLALTLAPMLFASVRRTVPAMRLALILVGTSVAVHGVLAGFIKISDGSGAMARRSHLHRARGIWLVTEADRSLEDAIVFLHATLPPGTPVFAGNTRHDCIAMNDALFYFLVERPPATRYHELHPGVATTATVQREIVRELQTRLVSHVLLFDAAKSTEPNDSSRPGSGLLDAFIRERFRPLRQFGPYSVGSIYDLARP